MQQSLRPLSAKNLRELPLFHRLDAKSAATIASHSRTLLVEKNELVLKRGDLLDGMFAVVGGRLKIYLLSCDGNERVIRLLQAGDCFGEAIMFNGIPSPVFVQTLSNAELCFLPKHCVYQALADQPDFTFSMLRALSNLMYQLIGDLEAACLQNARQRIAHYLLCQTQFGTPPYDELQLPASKGTVASTLNLSAETFSRELHQLERDGAITIERRLIRLLDRERLDQIAQLGSRRPLRN
jgi:CRP-like cAMP-binding protein